MFELKDERFGRLWRAAIKTVIKDIGIPEITWNHLAGTGSMPGALVSWYDPTPPGSLALSLSRPPEEVCLSLVHEMGHAMLSLGQVSEYAQDPHHEEFIVNGAADLICRHVGIGDYISRMTSAGVPFCVAVEGLSAATLNYASQIASQIIENLNRHAPAPAPAHWDDGPFVPRPRPGS